MTIDSLCVLFSMARQAFYSKARVDVVSETLAQPEKIYLLHTFNIQTKMKWELKQSKTTRDFEKNPFSNLIILFSAAWP